MFPKSLFFIMGTEFCDKFCYFGMRTILFLYLMEILRYSKETSTVIFHTFTMISFLFPLIAAIVADCWLGKYRTILYLSTVCVIGQLFLSASSTSWFHLPIREISLLGLFLIAVGSGGIKPCIASFGGEQFKLPEQEAQLSNFFTVFYLCVSTGGLLSTFITPVLRKDVTCFNRNTCYPLAFVVPSILMVSALVIFAGGKPTYNIKKPEGNVLFKVMKCICHAIRRKITLTANRKHWLDYADDAYDIKIIDDTKLVLRVLKLLAPLTMVWALYDQLGSRWTYQATRMNGEVFGYLIKPDQTGVFNATIFIILIPIFHWIIYPIIGRFCFINTSLRKITVGGILAATSFIISGLIELKLESTYVVQPSAGLGQIRIFNTINCPANLSLDGQSYNLEAFGIYQNLSIPVTGIKSLKYKLNVVCPSEIPLKLSGSINAVEEKALSYLMMNDDLQISLSDKIDKSASGDPMIRALILTDGGSPANLSLQLNSSQSYQLELRGTTFFTDFIEVKHNSYSISIDNVEVARDVTLKTGAVYTILGRTSTDGIPQINVVTIVQPNSVHMVWLLPQYLTMAFGEVMVFVTMQEFTYTQAPASMKSLVQAIWLLNSAIGNLIVVIITEAHFFHRQAPEFFLYAGLLYASMFIFAIMSIFYKYVNDSSNENFANDVMNQLYIAGVPPVMSKEKSGLAVFAVLFGGRVERVRTEDDGCDSGVSASESPGSINVVEEKTLSYLLRNDGLQISFSDTIEKSGSGDAMVRSLILTDKGTLANLSLRLDSLEHYQLKLHEDQFFTNFIEINHNMYNISINGVQIARDVSLKSGGVYTIIGRVSADGKVRVKTVTIDDPNSVHMFWLLPQYIVFYLGEIMFFVSGLEFAYTQAPASMKSLLQAIWLLNTAVGNLIVVVITEAHFFHRQILEVFLFAGIMYVDMIIFAIMAMFYKYVDNSPIDNIKKS